MTNPLHAPMFRLAIVAMILPFASAVLADVGGDDIQVYDAPPDLHYYQAPEIAAASNGDLFVAVYWNATIRVYKSVNGGGAWTLWGSLSGVGQETIAMGIAPGLYNDFLVIAYRDDRSGIRVALANPSTPTPIWSSRQVETFGAGAQNPLPRLAMRAIPGANPHVYLTYIAYEAGFPNPTRLKLVASINGGSTFPTKLVLQESGHFPFEVRHDVAVTKDGEVHVGWLEYDSNDRAWVYARVGENGGFSPGDWGSKVQVDTLNHGSGGWASIEVDPSGNAGILALHVRPGGSGAQTNLYFGARDSSGSFEWPVAKQVLTGYSLPLVAWGDEGPAISAKGGDGAYLLKPAGLITGPWLGERMIHGGIFDLCSLVYERTRRGWAVVAPIQYNYATQTVESWFDAEWRNKPGVGIMRNGEPIRLPGRVTSSPAIVDLGAGTKDVLLTVDSDIDQLVVYDGYLYSVNVGPTSKASAPVALNVGGDERKEVFVGTDDGHVYGFDSNLSPLFNWPVDLGTSQPVYVSGGAISGNKPGEVVAVSGNRVWCLDETGLPLPGFPYVNEKASGRAVGRAAIGDVDGDGSVEITAAFEREVVVLDVSGNRKRVLEQGTGQISEGVSIADLDGDQRAEIAVPHADGTLNVLHDDGTEFGPGWPIHPSEPPSPLEAVAIGGSADPQILAASQGGFIYRLDASGLVTPGWPMEVQSGVSSGPIVDGIGGNFAAFQGGLDRWGYMLRPDGSFPDWPRNMLRPVEVSPASDDLDGDGDLDLVIAAGEFLFVLDLGLPSTGTESDRWSQSGHNPARDSYLPSEVEITQLGFTVSPNVLNARSRGRWITGTLEFAAPHTTSDLDLASIRLNGVVPVDASAPVSEEDSDQDGNPELRVKFDRGAVISTLEMGDSVTVKVTGGLGSGRFEGSDVIRVIGGGNNARSKESAGAEFALGHAQYRRGEGVSLSFSLANSEAATLSMVDVNGRKVWSEEVGSYGPGPHVLSLGNRRGLASGIYIVRLIQGDRNLATKAMVLK